MELKGKIIDFLGDSITKGNGVTSAEYHKAKKFDGNPVLFPETE